MSPNPKLARALAAMTLCLCLIQSGAAVAFPPPGSADPLEQLLFPPDLVLQHQGAIQLSGAQRQSLVEEVAAAQTDFVGLQAELAGSGEQLQALLASTRIDEGAALATATQMMELETRIKRRHLELVIRIKNLLTPEQQRTLADLR